jgi:tetratricopeptide (TPR) repeat protein
MDVPAQIIFLSGRVALDDGTPPPDIAVIQRRCSGLGSGHAEAYTDSKGRFSFRVGENNAMIADASESSSVGPGMQSPQRNSNRGFSSGQLMGCELMAVLPGFRSEVVTLSGHGTFDNPDVGTIILHRLAAVEGRVISATSLSAPKDARKSFEKAQDLMKRQKNDEAVKNLEKAVDAYPKYAAAWCALGRLQAGAGQADAAHHSFEQAVAADPKFIEPYLHLAESAVRARKWQEAADQSDRAIHLDPFDYPQMHFMNAVANYNLQHFEVAEKSARQAEKLDSRHEYPKNNHLLGVILVQKHNYPEAAEEMRSYLKLAPGANDAAAVRTQLAEIEKLAQANPPAAQPAQQP